MRIKLFESFNEYYYEITSSEAIETSYSDDIKPDFTEKEISDIRNKVYEINDIRRPRRIRNCCVNCPYLIEIFNGPYLTPFITIEKMKDEWYSVSIRHNTQNVNEIKNIYFKCDQFEGLLKWLEDYV